MKPVNTLSFSDLKGVFSVFGGFLIDIAISYRII